MEKIELIENTINKIDHLIQEQLPESKYQFELYDLGTNTKHFRGLDEPFHWGSVYKLFVVAEIIKMAEEGLLNLDDELLLRKDLFKNGNGIVKSFTHLDRLTYIDACKMTIAVSDNLCADELLEVVGLERLNELFEKAISKRSKLNNNLDEIVQSLFSKINFENKAYFYRSSSFIYQFNNALNEILKKNYTNVSDLNITAKYILDKHLNNNSLLLFFDVLKTTNQHTRIEAYSMFSPIAILGKSGSIGFQSAFNQIAYILNKECDEPFAIFSILLKDNKHRNYETIDKFGLIGLEIANLYEEL